MAGHGTRELRYYKPRKGWTKVIEGKRYYFQLGRAKSPQDDASYHAALEEYLALLKKLRIETDRQLDPQTLPNGSSVEGTLSYLDWGQFATEHETKEVEKPQTVQALVNKYLEDRKLKADSGQLSLASYSSDKYRLAGFLSFCNYKGSGELQLVLSPEYLGEYRKRLLLALAQDKVSAVSVKHCLRTVKALLRWAYDEELIEAIPRKMRDYATVKLPEPEPQVFTPAEIRKLLKLADDKMRAWILLALNCGFTQTDIASLACEMIQKGRIIRKRHKTGIPSEYKLWERTKDAVLTAIEGRSPKGSDLVFLTDRGQPLVREEIKEDGRPSKTDSIAFAFSQLRKEAGLKLPFKCLKKTAASLIGAKFRGIESLYLAHVKPGTDKHYVREDWAVLDEALDWLETKLFEGSEGKDSGEPARKK